MLTVFLIAFALYAYTTPRTVTLADDALFIGNLHFFGVAHPPGYPLHTLLGGIFYHLLPFGTPAFKAHLFSGFSAAAACAALYACTAMLTTGRLPALAAAFACMVSKTFWSQAIVAEVYTLNALLFFVLLALTLDYIARGKKLWRLAAITGLGLANHYPLFILAASSIALYALVKIPNKLRTTGIIIVGGIMSAAPFYLWMVWRSYSTVPAHFYGVPIDSWQQFLHHLLRRGYHSTDNQPGVSWQDKLTAGEFIANEMLMQYTIAGALLAVVGFFIMLRRPHQRLLAAALLLSIFTTSIFLIIIRDFKASYFGLAIFRVYHLTSYGILAISLAIAIDAIAARLTRQHRRGLLTAAIAAVVVFTTAATHWQANNRRDYRWAEDLAMTKLTSVSPNAILFTAGDFDFPIGYLHYVRGIRPDVAVLSINGLFYNNPLYKLYAPRNKTKEEVLRKKETLDQFIDSTLRPVFFPLNTEYLFENEQRHSDMLGFYRRSNNEPRNRVHLSPQVLQWLKAHINDKFEDDRWSHILHTGTVQILVSAALTAHWEGAELSTDWNNIIAQARETNAAVDTLITSHALQRNRLDDKRIAARLQKCEHPDKQRLLIDEVEESAFYLLCAKLAWHAEGETSALGEFYLQTALAAALDIANPALATVFARYREQPCQAAALLKQFYIYKTAMALSLQDKLQDIAIACEQKGETDANTPKKK